MADDDSRDGPAPGEDASGDEPSSPEPGGSPRFGAREVVVPLRVYKIVTVFSTLIAAVMVVGGFLALDAATARASLPPAKVDPALAAVGLLAIAGGGAVYAYASRFRAPGMGTPKTGEDEGGDDG